jgi:hypothetical protein
LRFTGEGGPNDDNNNDNNDNNKNHNNGSGSGAHQGDGSIADGAGSGGDGGLVGHPCQTKLGKVFSSDGGDEQLRKTCDPLKHGLAHGCTAECKGLFESVLSDKECTSPFAG